jgi:hypothetical protein
MSYLFVTLILIAILLVEFIVFHITTKHNGDNMH